MKKQMIILTACLLMGSLAITGCKKKESGDTAVEATVTPSVTATLTPEPSGPVANTDEGSTNETASETTGEADPDSTEESYISETAAIKLIQDIIGERGYYFELLDDSLKLEDRIYYEYQISDGNENISPAVLVDKVSGELYCYNEDGSAAAFTEHPLYTEANTNESNTLENEFTQDDALAKLSKISAEELDLPEKLSEYKIIFDDWTTNVKGKECYGINVYSDAGDKMISMGLYYVAVDGTNMYRFDSLLDDFVVIKEAK